MLVVEGSRVPLPGVSNLPLELLLSSPNPQTELRQQFQWLFQQSLPCTTLHDCSKLHRAGSESSQLSCSQKMHHAWLVGPGLPLLHPHCPELDSRSLLVKKHESPVWPGEYPQKADKLTCMKECYQLQSLLTLPQAIGCHFLFPPVGCHFLFQLGGCHQHIPFPLAA